jgi:hypothetical protein
MTEAEWLACTDVEAMLRYLDDQRGGLTRRLLAFFHLPGGRSISRRKLEHFAIACCLRTKRVIDVPEWRQLCQLLEAGADEKLPTQQIHQAVRAANTEFRKLVEVFDRTTNRDDVFELGLQGIAFRAIRNAAYVERGEAEGWNSSAAACAYHAAFHSKLAMIDEGNEQKTQAAAVRASLLRDVIGNPFRPVILNPAWQTTNVTAIAQAIYDERVFERMPILGDALEDAGCDNADILNHCRQPGEHVRGCWVVDLILGKS